MQPRKRSFQRIIAFVFIHGIILTMTAQETNTWDYPINPKSSEWKNLRSYEEQLQAYNIPTEVLKTISTAELVKVCLAYPEWRLINAYSDRQIGFANVMGLFNGFHELLSRNDAPQELINVYAKMDPSAIQKGWTPLQMGIYGFRFVCIEMLLSNRIIINKLNDLEIRMLLADAVSKYERMQKVKDVYSLWDLSAIAGLCLNILDKDGTFIKENPDLKSFQRTFMTEDAEILSKIITKSKKY